MQYKKKLTLSNKAILVTGAAGFIGASLIVKLLKTISGAVIIGIDNLNDYYDVVLKNYRLKIIESMVDSGISSKFEFVQGDISDSNRVHALFKKYNPSIVVNLAAQAGVRHSITNPDAYINSNLIGFYNILEACRHSCDCGGSVEHLVYASSSSVYGGSTKIPFSEKDFVDNPVSLYAATKKSNELLAHSYSKLYNLPTTGLRFFTVYGPAGRPDMAYFTFTDRLRKGEIIQIYNYGNCKRDFTFIDDIVEGILLVMQGPPEKMDGADGLPLPPYSIYNIGNSNPENLLDFVKILSEELVKEGVLESNFDFESHRQFVPMQPGDVPLTYADTTKLENDFGFKPSTKLRTGLSAFAKWYRKYYMN